MVIKQLIYLAALAREQHFGRAARSCHISQPTLSAAIRQLEEEFGAPIVERGHRFNGFTAEGLCMLDYAKRILADCEALRQDIGKLKDGLLGRLRFGAIPTALPVVSLVTAPFHARFPLVTIAVMSHTSIEIQRGIDDFQVDVGLTYLDSEPLERVRTTPLYREEYILLTPQGGPFTGRDCVTWAEAAEAPLCLLTPEMQNRRIIDGIFRSIDRAPKPTVETNSIFNLCSHVSTGHWSSVMPKALLQFFGLPAGTFALPLVEPETTRTLGLIIADREPAPPLARSLFALTGSLDVEGAIARNFEQSARLQPPRAVTAEPSR
jgi:DNA-binding transcriptional LysR family regulator